MFMKSGDAISGQEGQATANINGRIEDLFYLKNLEATVEKQKSEIRTIGKRGVQYKAAGWSGSGSMTIYYVTSTFRKLMLEYIKKGKDTYFDITITNDDPTSTIGKQTTVLYDCNLDSIIAAKIDVDAEFLDEDIDFTFSDMDMLDEFGKPILGGN